MRFLSGAKARTCSYTVEPERVVMDMATGRAATTPALRAKFRDHRFDSEGAECLAQCEEYARQMSKPNAPVTAEEVRKRIEAHLLSHGDFGRSDGRGVFLDNTASLGEVELRARGVRRRCIFMQDVGEDTVQCGEFVESAESDYCTTHDAMMVEVVSGAGVGQSVVRKEEGQGV